MSNEKGDNFRGDIIVNLPMFCEIRRLLFVLFGVWGIIFVSLSESIIPDFVEIWNIVFKNKYGAPIK